MTRAGWHKVNAFQDDDYAEAEGQYRRETEQEPPVFGTVKLRIGRHWYMYDHVRGPLREALELHKPKGKRSLGAQYLAALLHSDELHREHLVEATPKLLEIMEQIKPI